VWRNRSRVVEQGKTKFGDFISKERGEAFSCVFYFSFSLVLFRLVYFPCSSTCFMSVISVPFNMVFMLDNTGDLLASFPLQIA